MLGAEHGLAEHEERFLAHLLPVIRHPPQKEPDQVLPPLCARLFLLFEPLRIPGIILQYSPDSIQRHRRHMIRCAGLHVAEGADEFVKLLRRKPQRHLPQPSRDRAGVVRLPGFQAPQHLHRDLVALVHPQDRRDPHKGFSCLVPHQHIPPHLDHVGKMGGDVKSMALVSVEHLVLQKLDVHDLLHPGRIGL